MYGMLSAQEEDIGKKLRTITCKRVLNQYFNFHVEQKALSDYSITELNRIITQTSMMRNQMLDNCSGMAALWSALQLTYSIRKQQEALDKLRYRK